MSSPAPSGSGSVDNQVTTSSSSSSLSKSISAALMNDVTTLFTVDNCSADSSMTMSDPAKADNQHSITSKSRIEGPEEHFIFFPKLPAEIRIRIWKLAAPGPRFILITRAKDRPAGMRQEEVEKLAWSPRSSTFSPALLFTCRESRVEMLKIYSILECATKIRKLPRRGGKTKSRPGNGETTKGMAVYCDFKQDFFCLDVAGRNDFFEQLSEQDRDRLSHLAIQDSDLSSSTDGRVRSHLPEDLLQLPGLEELIIARNMERVRLRKHGDETMFWKLCEGLQEDPGFTTRFPNWTQRAEEIIESYGRAYPHRDNLLVTPAYFVDKNRHKL